MPHVYRFMWICLLPRLPEDQDEEKLKNWYYISSMLCIWFCVLRIWESRQCCTRWGENRYTRLFYQTIYSIVTLGKYFLRLVSLHFTNIGPFTYRKCRHDTVNHKWVYSIYIQMSLVKTVNNRWHNFKIFAKLHAAQPVHPDKVPLRTLAHIMFLTISDINRRKHNWR